MWFEITIPITPELYDTKYYYQLQRNSLYWAARIANFEGIWGFSVPSIILGWRRG